MSTEGGRWGLEVCVPAGENKGEKGKLLGGGWKGGKRGPLFSLRKSSFLVSGGFLLSGFFWGNGVSLSVLFATSVRAGGQSTRGGNKGCPGRKRAGGVE